MSNLAPMKGGSFYNKNSTWQRQAMLPVQDVLQKALLNYLSSSSSSSPFVVADLGCSQGANSQVPVKLVISTIREKEAGQDPRPISVFHVDQPTNDFNSVFKVLSSEASYQRGAENVFSYCEGKSFYSPLFPPLSVDLFLSFCALHWISVMPRSTSLSISSTANHVDEGDRLAFSAQADKDLQSFLRLRHSELKPQGKAIISLVASNEHMQAESDVIEHCNEILCSFVTSRRLTQEEGIQMKLCIHYRSPAEIEKTLGECQALFKVEEVSYQRISHPLYSACLEGLISQKEYATVCSNFWKAVVEPSFLLSLDKTRSDTEKEEIMLEFFGKLESRLTEKPSPVYFYMAYISLTKI